ncbi:MAG TPA: hypothetical protein VMW35_02245 [Myxococcota bacterium]|nr:hypothetical protein [Myxococcota bacterium]
MKSKLSSSLCAAAVALAMATLGCRTVGTAGHSAGSAAGDAAEAAGHAAGTAARGAGDIIHDTSKAAHDEIRDAD